MKKLVLLILVIGALTPFAAASVSNVYIAQTALGNGDGSTCTNALAASFFNIAGNWGAGTTQIGPGTVVHLCGTISTTLTVQASGAAGTPITILFEPNARLSQPFCPGTGCIST